ncbi:unnamed protein product [marine sediment metagenome]|uniref:4'-phosphopantetheinyl transferase domain-containing protein n=1 Tax=marine sediment metagenome TaxID=412755 RepID=X1K808_9ZZZZ
MIGIDIIEIERIEAAVRRHPRILERLFTPPEIDLAKRYRSSAPFYAGRFAAKEAVAKALRSSLGWHEVEILADASGAPIVKLTGRAGRALSRLEGAAVCVSISHTKEHASAVALLVK